MGDYKGQKSPSQHSWDTQTPPPQGSDSQRGKLEASFKFFYNFFVFLACDFNLLTLCKCTGLAGEYVTTTVQIYKKNNEKVSCEIIKRASLTQY